MDLATGGERVGMGHSKPHPNPQSPTPNPQSP